MAADDPRGFVECRHLGGAVNPTTLRKPIEADGGRSAQFAKYAGDPAIMCSGQYVGRASADNSGGVALIGIIRDVFTNSGGLPRPLVFNQPGAGPVLAASVAGWVDINVDPFQTYVANTDTTVLGTHIGQYVGTTVGAALTAAGRSGFMVRIASATAVPNGDVPFQIVGFAPNNLGGLNDIGTEGNQDVEVIIANHVFKRGFVNVSGAVNKG